MNSPAQRILIVEDDPDIILMLATILEDEGYAVVTTDSGARLTSDDLTSDPPDAIVLDMLLSGWDGRDLARQLKGRETTQHIPILMLSAHPAAQREAIAAGADGFLSKPFDIDALLAKIAALLR